MSYEELKKNDTKSYKAESHKTKFKALTYKKIKSLKLELFTLLVIFHSKLLSSSEKKNFKI